MPFQPSRRNYALTTGVTTTYMILPQSTNSTFLIYNPGTAVQYFEFSDGTNLPTLAAPVGTASGATATPSNGLFILPGQAIQINRNINTNPVYFFGLSPGGASQLNISEGSGY